MRLSKTHLALGVPVHERAQLVDPGFNEDVLQVSNSLGPILDGICTENLTLHVPIRRGVQR